MPTLYPLVAPDPSYRLPLRKGLSLCVFLLMGAIAWSQSATTFLGSGIGTAVHLPPGKNRVLVVQVAGSRGATTSIQALGQNMILATSQNTPNGRPFEVWYLPVGDATVAMPAPLTVNNPGLHGILWSVYDHIDQALPIQATSVTNGLMTGGTNQMFPSVLGDVIYQGLYLESTETVTPTEAGQVSLGQFQLGATPAQFWGSYTPTLTPSTSPGFSLSNPSTWALISVQFQQLCVSIACPGDVTEFFDANCQFVLPDYTGLVTDNCTPAVTVTQTPAPGAVLTVDSTVVTINAGNGTDSTCCVFNFVLVDTVAPMITVCPPPDTVEGCAATDITLGGTNLPLSTTTTGISYAQFMMEGGAASDNCGIDTAFYTDVITPGNPIVVTRTYVVHDVSDNAASCVQVLSVIDLFEGNTLPNANDLTPSLDVAGDVCFQVLEIAGNVSCAEPVDILVETESGARVYYGVGLIRTDFIKFNACAFRGTRLKANINGINGSSWSYLTIRDAGGPIIGPGRSKDVYCVDPLVFGGHIDDEFPTAYVPCGGPVEVSGGVDWVETYVCGPAFSASNDTVKVIYREYAAIDKRGNRASVFDTITVFRLPPISVLSSVNAYCAEKDTTYCGEGFAGPYMVYPERCDPTLPVGMGNDPDMDRTFCDTIYFLVYDDTTQRWIPNPVFEDAKCGISVHLDKWEFGSNGCEEQTRYTLEIKQSCPGTLQAVCGIDPPLLASNAFVEVSSGYYRCEFWLTDLDTLAPMASCKLDKIGEQNVLWPLSFDSGAAGAASTHCFPVGAPVIVVDASDHDCAGHTYLPPICVYEDWSGVKQVKATIEGVGSWVLESTGDTCEFMPPTMVYDSGPYYGICYESHVQVKLPKTDEPIEVLYEIYDSCHNLGYVRCYMIVKDRTRPVAVSDKGVTVSLSDKKVWVDAQTFDEGSWDNCGVNLLLARRTDWYKACVDLCDTLDWCCVANHNDTLWQTWLETDKHIDEVEAHYAKTMEWLKSDNVPCGDIIYNAWQYDLMKYATQVCADPSYPIDDATFRHVFEECWSAFFDQIVFAPERDQVEFNQDHIGLPCKFETVDLHPGNGCKTLMVNFCNEPLVTLTNASKDHGQGATDEEKALFDMYEQIGGGWSDAVPFDCSDACGPVTVEILVMDYWCNWSTAWTKAWVEDKTPVEVVKDVVDEEQITCKIYKEDRYAYPDEIHPVSLEYIVGQAKDSEQDAYDALDEIFGGYCKAWRDPYGNYVDNEGTEIDCDITFYDSVCKCTSYYDQVRVYDEHLGYLWVDSLITKCHYYQDTIDFQKGVVVVNCEENVYCEQDVWCEIDHCGQGYIFRKFKIWQGCPDEFYDEHGVVDSLRHTVDTIYRHQRIWIGNECELNKYMFHVPYDTEVVTCDIEYGPDGNVIGAAGPESTGYATYKFDDDCRIVGIGHSDKVFKIVGGEAACYKILRTWYFADWCGNGEPLDGQWWRSRELVTDTCVQQIVVRDTTPPACTIIGPVEDGGSIEVGACYFDLTAGIVATDACGLIKYYWDLKDITDPDNVTLFDADHGELQGDTIEGFNMSSNNLPHGSYKLMVTVQDDCANESYCEYHFDVVSVKKPSSVCISSLTARLTPWDSDLDGVVDSAHAIVWAEEFNSSSSEACTDTALEYRVELIDGIDDGTWQEDTSYLEVFCEDFGSHMARLWVISWPSGTVDFCDVVLIVQSDFSGCATTVSGEPGPISQVNDMHDVVGQPRRQGIGQPTQPGIGGRPVSQGLAPSGYLLEQNRPNPFREETTIGFVLPEAMTATLTVYDVTGRVLRSIKGDYSKGYQTVELRKQNLDGHAILYYRLDAKDFTATRKMILMN